MKKYFIITVVFLAISLSKSFAQKIPPFDKIGKEILFIDTLLTKNDIMAKIKSYEDHLKLESLNANDISKAYYNLAICYAAKKDTIRTFDYLNRCLKNSAAFHNLILTDSDFRQFHHKPEWYNIINQIEKQYLTNYPTIPNKDLAVELFHIFLKDQQSRGLGVKRKDAIVNYDAENLKRIEEIIKINGWPTYSMVGKQSSEAAFLVIQHSDFTVQKKYYEAISNAVKNNEASKEAFALITDKINIRTKGVQIYGTQVYRQINKLDGTVGKFQYYPIEDEINVDLRRKTMDLVPLRTYLANFGIDYKP